MLVQRFMLNLRQLNQGVSEDWSQAQNAIQSSVSFRAPARALGNLGEPLDYGASLNRYEDENDLGMSATGSQTRHGSLEEGSGNSEAASPVYTDDAI